MITDTDGSLLSELIPEEELDQVIEILEQENQSLDKYPDNSTRRYECLKKKVFSGSLRNMVEVIRDLVLLKREKIRMSQRERTLGNKLQESFTDVLARIKNLSWEDAELLLKESLELG
jgi:RNA polymerase-interacting CarD/CdnL/TRCF family regulator